MLSNWHWKVVDPPIRTERVESPENKIRLVRMILHIVVNLSKQPPLAVKKTLENLQVNLKISWLSIHSDFHRKKWWDSFPAQRWWRQFSGTLLSWIRISIFSKSVANLWNIYIYNVFEVLHQRGVSLDDTLWPVPSLIFSLEWDLTWESGWGNEI